MTPIFIRFFSPEDLTGRLIAWWLSSAYSHASLEIGETAYHATFPSVRSETPPSRMVSQPPRGGVSLCLMLSDTEARAAIQYCRAMVGTHYDVAAVFGWLVHAKWMDRPDRVYCFELVYDALAVAGIFSASRRLITGEQLMADCLATGRALNKSMSRDASRRLARQRQPIILPTSKLKQKSKSENMS